MAIVSRLPQGNDIEGQLINYTMLYDEGNEYTALTGGWAVDTTQFSNNFGETVNLGYDSFNKNNSSMTIKSSYTDSGANNFKVATVSTKNPIDLSQYNMIGIVADASHTSTSSYNSAGSVRVIHNSTKNASALTSISIIEQGTKSQTITASGFKTSAINRITKDYIGLQITSARYETTNIECTLHNMILFKNDNWQTWISKAGLSTSIYSTLKDVIADVTALNTLMNNNSAVTYMLMKCTGTVMASVIQNENALKAIRGSQYRNRIFKNEHWNKFLTIVGEVDTNADFAFNYTALDYIQTNGTQYIDTKVNLNSCNTSYEIDLDFMYLNDKSEHAYFFGTQNTTQPYNYVFLRTYDSNVEWGLWGMNNSVISNAINQNTRHYTKSNYTSNGVISLTVDNSIAYTATDGITDTHCTTYPLFIGARNLSGTADCLSRMKIYSSRILLDDIIVRNYVPCYRKSDYVAGLYDMVEGKFYTNAGTGEFITEPKEHATYLYNEGDECTDITGGWETYYYTGNSNYTANNINTIKYDASLDTDVLQGVSGDKSRQGGFTTTNLIDFSKYNSLYALVKVKSSSGGTNSGATLIAKSTKPSANNDGENIAYYSYNQTEYTTIKVDLSNVTNSGYVCLVTWAYYDSSICTTISKVWLE